MGHIKGTSTMYTKGSTSDKRTRYIDAQANVFAAIAGGVKGKELGSVRRLATVASEQYMIAGGRDRDACIAEAHQIAGTKRTDAGIVKA